MIWISKITKLIDFALLWSLLSAWTYFERRQSPEIPDKPRTILFFRFIDIFQFPSDDENEQRI